ncbi:MAG: hypothetical protein LKH27_08300 [Prevotella sp.]|jgi:hypothetical protein|nr:hypothetical protein [Prevotella sp.]MCH3993001.1 hypothetical protein [Prevotella sp.]MCI1474398.1 hypothetical protein [Prevotella sp.]
MNNNINNKLRIKYKLLRDEERVSRVSPTYLITQAVGSEASSFLLTVVVAELPRPRADQSHYGRMAFRDCPRRTRIHTQVLRFPVLTTLDQTPARCVSGRINRS